MADAAGASTASERVFRGVSPGENDLLRLRFTSMRGAAMVSGIDVLPMQNGKVRLLRIRSGWTSDWRDPQGETWRADSYLLDGNALARSTHPARDNRVGLRAVGL